ncbi:unnamed protein product, partial [Owenia fusiformis]
PAPIPEAPTLSPEEELYGKHYRPQSSIKLLMSMFNKPMPQKPGHKLPTNIMRPNLPGLSGDRDINSNYGHKLPTKLVKPNLPAELAAQIMGSKPEMRMPETRDFMNGDNSRRGPTRAPTRAPTQPPKMMESRESRAGTRTLFATFAGQHGFGGTLQTSFTTSAACISGCEADATCVALDFNSGTNGCWFHTDPLICSALLGTKATCTHYQIIDCTSPVVEVFTNMNIFGGSFVSTANTLDQCLNSCTGTCSGVDYNFVTNDCFIHTTTSGCGTMNFKTDCNHYKKLACSGTTTAASTASGGLIGVLETFSGYHAFGGTYMPSATDVATCVNTCINNCEAVDFNSASNLCFHHSSSSSCSSLNPKTSCTHYKKVSCSTTVTAVPPSTTTATTTAAPTTTTQGVVETYTGFNLFGGTFQSGISSSAACIAACQSSSTCEALDFNSADNSCWFHTSSSSCGALNAKSTCTHYKLVSCTTTTAGPSTVTTTTTAAPTTTTVFGQTTASTVSTTTTAAPTTTTT